jgi:hypothetical protein
LSTSSSFARSSPAMPMANNFTSWAGTTASHPAASRAENARPNERALTPLCCPVEREDDGRGCLWHLASS